MNENISSKSQTLTLSHAPGSATARIQAALDQAKNGSLHLTLGPGEHLCAGLRIFSDTTLELAKDAVLQFLPDYAAYAETEVAIAAEGSNRGMIVASGAAHITLCGAGRIACNGSDAFSRGDDAHVDYRRNTVLQ